MNKIIQLKLIAQELKENYTTLEAQLYWLNVYDLKDSEKGFIYYLLTR